MSVRGVKQLTGFVFRYSDRDGSSRGMRKYLRENIVDFAKQNPQAHISTELKRSKHPFMRATYANNKSKTIGVKNYSPEQIAKSVRFLADQKGFKVTYMRYRKPVVSDKPSIQGVWNEVLDLHNMELELEHQY